MTYCYNSHGQIITATSTGSELHMYIDKNTFVTDLTDSEVNASEAYRFMKRRFDINRPLAIEHYIGTGFGDSTLVGGVRTVYGLKTTSSDTLLVKNRVEKYDMVSGK